jgi:isopenicillin N synthase-like dioxygenase
MAKAPLIISLADYETRKPEITAQLMESAKTSGFFYIKDHGIPQETIAAMHSTGKKYFHQPAEEKDKLPKVIWEDVELVGYERNDVADGTIREACFMKCDGYHPEMDAAWPKESLLPGFKEQMVSFQKLVPPVAKKIVGCLALGLGYPEDFFEQTMNERDPDNHTLMLFQYYNEMKGLRVKGDTNRITAHTDETLITLLFNELTSTGLEIAMGKDGKAVTSDTTAGQYMVDKWHPTPPVPGCIIVNIGDTMQYWSDGELLSNFHRVRCPRPDEHQGERITLAYFVWPNDRDIIQGKAKKYPPITMKEFMKIKGQQYSVALSTDPKVYEAQQAITFGAPEVPALQAITV